jgi:hypothetical protein
MRHATLCGNEVRLEFFPDRGVASTLVSVDGDFEERTSALCDPERLRAVLDGVDYHLTGPDWMCSMTRSGDVIRLDIWRDGLSDKLCSVPVSEFESVLAEAFGLATKAYAA